MCTDTQTQRHRNTLKHIQGSDFCPKAHIHPFIHKYLSGAFWVPGTMLGYKDTVVNRATGLLLSELIVY